jgi:hypothetical protein
MRGYIIVHVFFINLIWLYWIFYELGWFFLPIFLLLVLSHILFVIIMFFKNLRHSVSAILNIIAGPCSFARSCGWPFWFFFFIYSIKELINIILIFKRITKHVKIWWFPSSFKALPRGIGLIYNITWDRRKSMPSSNHLIGFFSMTFTSGLVYSWRILTIWRLLIWWSRFTLRSTH